MKILIVEDDEHKSSQILELINMAGNPCNTLIVDNVLDAVRFLRESIPDKLILDMSLPSHKAFPGEGTPVPLPTGGIEILFELKKKKQMSLPILILTQYPEILIEGEPVPVDKSAGVFSDEYGFKNIEACYYDHVDRSFWKKSTISFLRKIDENTSY